MALKAVQRQTEAVGKMDIREEKTMSQEKVIVLDFGGQYNQLIARRVNVMYTVKCIHTPFP